MNNVEIKVGNEYKVGSSSGEVGNIIEITKIVFNDHYYKTIKTDKEKQKEYTSVFSSNSQFHTELKLVKETKQEEEINNYQIY